MVGILIDEKNVTTLCIQDHSTSTNLELGDLMVTNALKISSAHMVMIGDKAYVITNNIIIIWVEGWRLVSLLVI